MYEWIGYIFFWTLAVFFTCGLVQWAVNRWIGRPLTYHNKHVLVTGGSSGLGKAYAALVAKKGAKVTILARNRATLALAAEEIGFGCATVSADVNDTGAVAAAIEQAESIHGKIAIVAACAGAAEPVLVDAGNAGVFRRQIELNYLGTVHVVLACLSSVVAECGAIVLVDSECALISFAGYGAYAPSKFAVRAFGDALRNEMVPKGVRVHCFHPGSIATAGYDKENETKPEVTARIEGSSVLVSPEDCAEALNAGLQAGSYHITTNMGGALLRAVSNGCTPRDNVFWDTLVAPLAVLASFVFTYHIDAEAKTV